MRCSNCGNDLTSSGVAKSAFIRWLSVELSSNKDERWKDFEFFIGEDGIKEFVNYLVPVILEEIEGKVGRIRRQLLLEERSRQDQLARTRHRRRRVY